STTIRLSPSGSPSTSPTTPSPVGWNASVWSTPATMIRSWFFRPDTFTRAFPALTMSALPESTSMVAPSCGTAMAGVASTPPAIIPAAVSANAFFTVSFVFMTIPCVTEDGEPQENGSWRNGRSIRYERQGIFECHSPTTRSTTVDRTYQNVTIGTFWYGTGP